MFQAMSTPSPNPRHHALSCAFEEGLVLWHGQIKNKIQSTCAEIQLPGFIAIEYVHRNRSEYRNKLIGRRPILWDESFVVFSFTRKCIFELCCKGGPKPNHFEGTFLGILGQNWWIWVIWLFEANWVLAFKWDKWKWNLKKIWKKKHHKKWKYKWRFWRKGAKDGCWRMGEKGRFWGHWFLFLWGEQWGRSWGWRV